MPAAAKKKVEPVEEPVEEPVAAEEPNPLLDKPLEKIPAITASRFGLADEYRNVWRVTCDMDTKPEHALEQGYWAHVSMNLRPGDRIVVVPDNFAWELHLRVIGAGRLYAHVIKLEFYQLTPATPPEKLPSIYTIGFAGAHHKWRVVREGQPLKDGFETEALARRWAANHEAAVDR